MQTQTLMLNGTGTKHRVAFKDGADHKVIVIGAKKVQTVTVNDDTRVTFAA